MVRPSTESSSISRSRRCGRRQDQSSRSHPFSDESGDVAATTILAGLSMLLVMFVVQMGLYYHARSVMNAAAQDGARAAQVENATEADATAAANQILAGSSNLLVGEAVAVSLSADEVTVSVTADVFSIFPGFDGPLVATASGPVERFRPQAER